MCAVALVGIGVSVYSAMCGLISVRMVAGQLLLGVRKAADGDPPTRLDSFGTDNPSRVATKFERCLSALKNRT